MTRFYILNALRRFGKWQHFCYGFNKLLPICVGNTFRGSYSATRNPCNFIMSAPFASIMIKFAVDMNSINPHMYVLIRSVRTSTGIIITGLVKIVKKKVNILILQVCKIFLPGDLSLSMTFPERQCS